MELSKILRLSNRELTKQGIYYFKKNQQVPKEVFSIGFIYDKREYTDEEIEEHFYDLYRSKRCILTDPYHLTKQKSKRKIKQEEKERKKIIPKYIKILPAGLPMDVKDKIQNDGLFNSWATFKVVVPEYITKFKIAQV